MRTPERFVECFETTPCCSQCCGLWYIYPLQMSLRACGPRKWVRSWCSETWVGLWVEVFGTTPGNLLILMVAWADLNYRPRPYQGSVVRFYNLQDRGDCQTTRKSYKAEILVGWVVGWKKSTNSETTPHSFPRTSRRTTRQSTRALTGSSSRERNKLGFWFLANSRGKKHPISNRLTVSKGFDRQLPSAKG